MTAREIFDLVKVWPREARPEDVEFDGDLDVWCIEDVDGNPSMILEYHAALMFEASGLAWLLARCLTIAITPDTEGVVDLAVSEPCKVSGKTHTGTRLGAISAAVLAAKEAKT